MHLLKLFYQLSAQYLKTKLSRAQFVMLIAMGVGLVSGLVAVILKMLVHYIQLKINEIPVSELAFLFFPTLGLLVCVYITYNFLGGAFERGVAMVLKSIAQKSSYIPFKHTYLHVLTSSITVGLGGSAGLEAPIVATGSAVGSNLARISNLPYPERSLMIACGAAAGISAVFNAPIAGVIFAIEVLLSETIISYFIPLMISSVVGALCSKIILDEKSLFNFSLKQQFDYHNVPMYILLGIFCGFVALYYAKVFKWTEGRLHRWRIKPMVKALIGGLMLVTIFVFFQPLFGEGYESIKTVANGSFASFKDPTKLFSFLEKGQALLVFTALIILLKPVAAGITIGSGGNGGNFAPSLFTGAYLGFFFSRLMNKTGWVTLPEGNFSLVAMAGILSGIMYCPLTAIFLIAEITNGYTLFIPLMIVSSISYFIAKSYEPYSMDIKKLALEGKVFTHRKEQNILMSIKMKDIVKNDYESIGMEKTLADLVNIIKVSEKNIFAVKDKHGKFAGIIELNDIKQRLFKLEEHHSTSILAIMKKPPAVIKMDTPMQQVMDSFDVTQSWYLPVVDGYGMFEGFISKTKLFAKYRQFLTAKLDLHE